jgi:hypothetical protein
MNKRQLKKAVKKFCYNIRINQNEVKAICNSSGRGLRKPLKQKSWRKIRLGNKGDLSLRKVVYLSMFIQKRNFPSKLRQIEEIDYTLLGSTL